MPNPTLDQDRVAHIKSRLTDATTTVSAWHWPDKELPRVRLDVNWVRFSTRNHRTTAEQRREIAISGRPDLFTADPLGKRAQDVQYSILKSQEGFEALKEDLTRRGQQEPAIVTAEGVLINGNRRTAALRSLYLDDSHLDAQHVHCLVLPEEAEEDDFVNLEAELQIARDFKQGYSWINEALLIEELYGREGRDYHKVAARMHRDVASVRSLHDKLQQVHQLVYMSNGARLHIDFTENESAFDELAKHIKNKSSAEANNVQSVYFLGTLANVQYRKLRNLRRDDAAQLVRRELDSDVTLKPLLEEIGRQSEPVDGDDLIDDLLGAPSAASPLDDVLAFLARKKPEETITLADGETLQTKDVLGSLQTAITAVADEAGEEERDQTAVRAPILRVEKAITELRRVLIALPKARAFSTWDESAMDRKLEELEELLVEIKELP